tara:strand:+ start:1964 stop:2818 length:855 start_codon:yes stop_codon:yes gene_type:complete
MDIPKGILIPIGGNEDKGENEHEGLDFITEGILYHVVNESGGKDAKIVVIPTASSIPKIVGKNYKKAFKKLECTNVKVAKIKKRSKCEDEKILNMIAEADCIMFSGGDQSRISAIIGGTAVHDLIAKKYKNEKCVIAGTSAGAMAMASHMIAGGSPSESFIKGAVRMKKGLHLIPELVVDTHFVRRGRFGRLAEAVAIHPGLIGVGLAEDTGIIIRNHHDFQIIGSGMVIVMDAGELGHNAHSVLKKGTPMTMSNLKTHILANGDRFDLKSRMVHVLALEEKFI